MEMLSRPRLALLAVMPPKYWRTSPAVAGLGLGGSSGAAAWCVATAAEAVCEGMPASVLIKTVSFLDISWMITWGSSCSKEFETQTSVQKQESAYSEHSRQIQFDGAAVSAKHQYFSHIRDRERAKERDNSCLLEATVTCAWANPQTATQEKT